MATRRIGWSTDEFLAEVQKVRDEQPTLNQVLRAAGIDGLAESCTVPFTPDRAGPLMPEQRGLADFPPGTENQMLPMFAMQLADLQAGDLPQRARMLLGLESHAMFAAASRQENLSMRHRFGDLGPYWARAVLANARLMKENGARDGVRDAIGWLVSICAQLQLAMLMDLAARDLVLECLSWSRDVHAEYGDADAAASLDAVLATLQSLLRGTGESAS